MTGTPLEIRQRHMVFATSCGMRSKPSPRARTRGPALGVGRGGTSSHDFPSAWSTSGAMTKSRSLQWLMVDAVLATGGPESVRPHWLGRGRMRREEVIHAGSQGRRVRRVEARPAGVGGCRRAPARLG